ncbi:MAG: hypothetical protein Q4G34_02765 [Micrococcus sp.]|nr:hypothetical protein [Micrococcus sp.]
MVTSVRLTLPQRPSWVRWLAGAVLPGVVVLQVVVAGLQTFVLNPLAAAPEGMGLGEIYRVMRDVGEAPFVLMPLLILALGLLAAVALVFVSWRREEVDPLPVMALGFGAVICATPAYFLLSFNMGMSLADTFGITGGDHSPWAWPIYLASIAAIIAFPLCMGAALVRGRRR